VHDNYGSTSLSSSVSQCLIASYVFSSQSGLLEMYFGRKSRYEGSLRFLTSSTLISTFRRPQQRRNSQQLDFSPRNSLGKLSSYPMIGGGWNRDLPEGCRTRGSGKAGLPHLQRVHILDAFPRAHLADTVTKSFSTMRLPSLGLSVLLSRNLTTLAIES